MKTFIGLILLTMLAVSALGLLFIFFWPILKLTLIIGLGVIILIGIERGINTEVED